MAFDLRSIAAPPDVGPQSRTPERQSFIRAVFSQRKRQSRDNPALRPDPFRYGDPNPLDCHPYFSDKHPDYIVRPHTVQRPLSFPVLSPTPTAARVSIYGQDDLDAYRSQGFVPRLLRAESLVAILDFFDSNTLTRAMANSTQAARRPPEIPPPQQISPFPTIVRRHSDISLQDFVRDHEVTAAQRIEKESRCVQNCKSAPITPPPTPPKADSRCASRRRPLTDSEASIKHSSNSGLPKGWKATHDRFIAYLDTHAPLTGDGEIPFRESKRPRYTVEQMILLLKQRFVRFRTIPIPTWAIERRLEILDYRDNNYFDMPYLSYAREFWGKGI